VVAPRRRTVIIKPKDHLHVQDLSRRNHRTNHSPYSANRQGIVTDIQA
jgi:hypothetical protein